MIAAADMLFLRDNTPIVGWTDDGECIVPKCSSITKKDIIMATPGWHVPQLIFSEDSKYIDRIESVAVVGWEVERTFASYRKGGYRIWIGESAISVKPITIEDAMDDGHLIRPDGKVVLPYVETWDSIDQFLNHLNDEIRIGQISKQNE